MSRSTGALTWCPQPTTAYAPCSGSLVTDYGPRPVFWVTALFPLIVTAAAAVIPEERVTRATLAEAGARRVGAAHARERCRLLRRARVCWRLPCVPPACSTSTDACSAGSATRARPIYKKRKKRASVPANSRKTEQRPRSPPDDPPLPTLPAPPCPVPPAQASLAPARWPRCEPSRWSSGARSLSAASCCRRCLFWCGRRRRARRRRCCFSRPTTWGSAPSSWGASGESPVE